MYLRRFLPFFFVVLGILQPANAQTALSIKLTCPLSGQVPFSPSCQWSYSGSVGSVNIVISWGDGSFSNVTSCGYSCPGHTYTIVGNYTIAISITDSTGATVSDSNAITVNPPKSTIYAVEPTYNIQVGAWGDDASRGNMGVGVEIRTSIFSPASQDSLDAFWVGDNLQNGSFIQFGYEVSGPAENACLYAHVIGASMTCLGGYDNVTFGDARWFWQYWRNGSVIDFYSGIGPANSAGANGTWHQYRITPNVADGWDFALDGQTVWSFNNVLAIPSKDPAFMVAEEVTGVPSASGNLGPVEFRNLSYLSPTNVWTQVKSLTAISGCGALNPNCGISIPYGVTVLGANDVLAGTGQASHTTGELLLVVLSVTTQVTSTSAALSPTVELTPTSGVTGTQVHVRGSGFMTTDTSCTISSPTSPNLIFGTTGACTIQSGTGIVIGEFIIGIVPPGNYVVQVTGNQGDVAQATVTVQ